MGDTVTTNVVVDGVAWDDADAAMLRDVQQRELAVRYGVQGGESSDVGAPVDPEAVVATVLVRVGGEPVACGTVRDVSGADDGIGGVHGPGTGEVKRVFVVPTHRGRGLSRLVMAELEGRAVDAGLRRIVLETGTRQPEAIGLYLSLGFTPIDRYGEYAESVDSRCFAKTLGGVGGGGGGGRSRVDGATGEPVSVEVREVEWASSDAVELRREMSETSSTVLYPEVADYLAAAGGFDVVDAALGERVTVMFVAYRAGEPVGCVALRHPDAGAPERAVEVVKLFVRASARRGRVARTLMATAERAARESGARTLILETGFRQPPAIALYSSLGFRPIEPYPPYDGNHIAFCFAKRLV